MTSLDIKIEELKYVTRSNLRPSALTLKIHGNSIDESIVNGLRRIALSAIPTYAFSVDTIDIEKSESASSNDMIRLRLSNMPIYDISPSIYYLPKEYWDETKVDYSDKTRETYRSGVKRLFTLVECTNIVQCLKKTKTIICANYLLILSYFPHNLSLFVLFCQLNHPRFPNGHDRFLT